MDASPLYISIDLTSVDLLSDGKLPHSPQLDFCHSVLYALNRTSLWQCGRIRAFLEAKRAVIEVSPLLIVPPSLKEFRRSLKSALRGEDVLSGRTRLLTVRDRLRSLPPLRFTVSPRASRVISPTSVSRDPVLLCLSMRDECCHYEHACFSRYPLSPLNQCLSVVSAREAAASLC